MNPTSNSDQSAEETRSRSFIEQEIDADLKAGRLAHLHTRFPPEPNGYLHLGHAKAICVNFGLAARYPGGTCNLRFDDTNPESEETKFVECIQEDIRWLGFDWEERLFFASDFFEELFGFAVELINKGLAYVDDQSVGDIRAGRGSASEPGVDSPHRDRPVEENLELFQRMRAGEFTPGSRVLRAKIDMTSAHMLMRDPVLYRILEGPHHRTGDSWHVYPTYDWAHGQCDALEGITHSLCSLEFANHRPLYDWCLDSITAPSRPRQIEFGRLSVSYTITSKRFLKELVADGHVAGWDDPRMSTLRGMRRRGYTPEAIRDFCDRAGGGKVNVTVDMALLESCLREDLNRRCARRMAVLRPLKVVIETLADDEAIDIEAVNNPEDDDAGTRPIRLTREIWIDRDDFLEEAPRKYFRLAPGREVRLRWGYCITCREVVKDPASGEVVELRCTHDPETGGGKAPDGRKVKGVIHWVSAADAVDAEVRLYDHLFKVPDPTVSEDGEHWIENLNPESLEVLSGCKLEPSLLETRPGESFQFERLGYFCADSEDHSEEALVFNRTVSLRDSWARKRK